MKKILVFALVLMPFMHLKASFLHKALRAAVPLAALAATGFPIKNTYDANKALNEPIPNRLSIKIFGEETQKALREHYKILYTPGKPLCFGVIDEEIGAYASTYAGLNYIFLGYGLLPKFKFSEPPKRLENELEEDFAQRRKDYWGIQKDKEHKQYDEFLRNPPMEEFKERLEPITSIVKHEMGHLIYEHPQKRISNKNKLTTEMAIVSALLNGYIVKSSFAKNITKAGLLGKIAAIASFMPFTYFYSAYKQNALARLQECEADDFAIKNAESKKELLGARAFLEGFLKSESEIKNSFLMNIYDTYMGTHPSASSRIEKIQKAIDNWQE